MTFRRGELRDLAALVDGNAGMALETEGLSLDRTILEAGVRAVLEGRAPATYFVLEHEARIVAQLMITFEWSDWRNKPVWWIQSVWVPEDERQKGHFRALHDAVLAEARAAGAGGLRLYVDARNTRAQAVYRALGMDGEHYRVFERMEL